MARSLENKTVIVTGGAAGIGYEIANRFLQKGAKVVIILDINEEQAEEAVRTLNSKYGNNKSVFMKCDVTSDLEAVSKKILDAYRYVDVLVNNAGIHDVNSAKNNIDVNVTAVIEWSLKFWELMRIENGGKGGTIINIASIYGFRVDPFVPVYQASKFAVMGFIRSLGFPYNFKRTNVRVVAICPGFTETALTTSPKTYDIVDEQLQVDLEKFVKEQAWQKVDAVGKAAVKVFERAESGTAWLIEGSKPIEEVK